MPKPKIVISRQTPGIEEAAVLKSYDVWMWQEDSVVPQPVLKEQARDAEGVIVTAFDPFREDLVQAAARLRVVSNYGVGVDNLDLKALSARGIPAGNTPGVVTEATADMAMALLLAMSREIVRACNYVKAKQWTGWSPTLMISNDVYGKTLGLVGMGRIGQAIAKRAQGFSMRILYHTRTRRPEAEQAFGARHCPYEELLRESDIVLMICPLTPETRHMVNDAAFAQMKPGAMLVNAARGPVVDPKALYRALSAGRIKAAALDVTDPEPIPPGDPLLTLDNLIIAPHIATSTWETRRRMTEIAVANLVNGMQGKPLLHCVNP